MTQLSPRSWLCIGCQESLRSHLSTMPKSRWMTDAVLLFEDGDRVSGEYDGYGRVGAKLDPDGLRDSVFCVYHRACWEALGRPTFVAPSARAADQGYFVGEFHPSEPKTIGDCINLSKKEA